MTLSNKMNSYAVASISLHWGMALLIALVYALIELREFFPKGSEVRETMKVLHFMLGLCVLALVAVRIWLHWAHPAPPIQPPPPLWQKRAAMAVHLALMLFMVAMPILGWLLLSAEGKPIPFFGLDLPALIGTNEAIAGWSEELHEALGTIGYFLIGLHTAAALYHHYFLRDNNFRRMVPHRP
jgi:cytochrome b561